LLADGAALWVDRGIIAQNSGTALSATGSAEVVLRNCFIGGANDVPALSATISSVTVQYTTVGAGAVTATAVECDDGSQVVVSDSVILSQGNGPEVVCMPLTATRSASNTAFPAGMDNVEVGVTMAAAWFTSYNTGDFHLTPGGQGIFMGIAEWNDGDPSVDIDDAPRAGMDPTPEHAGADLP
jgi:hypothetical protein